MYLKAISVALFMGSSAFSVLSQNVVIPNTVFKNYLVGNPAINTNADTEIQVTEASAFTGTINVFNLGITDLTGIESFTAITGLNCNNNNLTSLTISSNTALTTLTCSLNNLTTLDVSFCPALTSLTCISNDLTAINLSSNTLLEYLNLSSNYITALDLSANTALTTLQISNNSISVLNLTANTALEILTVHGNQMTSLVLPATTTLWIIESFNNNLTTLDVSVCPNLTHLWTYTNQLQTMDFTNNPLLAEVLLMSNQLTSVNMANGGNTNVTWFSSVLNPNLPCIQVDNAAYSTSNWPDIDATSSYSECCAGSSSGTDIQTVCGPSFTWIDGNTYYSDNTSATHVLQNAVGCDSIVTLDLTILPSSNTIDQRAGCAPYTWIDGNDYYASNTTATHVLTAANGCDSIITLNLTIGPYTYAGNEVITACNEYTWIDGMTYTSSTNTPYVTYQAVNFCDSTIYLDLTIETVNTTITNSSPLLYSNALGASYQWIDCDNGNAFILGETNAEFTATTNGSYACIIEYQNCTVTSDCIFVTNVGIEESDNETVRVSPNPTKDMVHIETTFALEKIEIYNVAGERLMTVFSTDFSLEELSNGVYLIVVTSGAGVYQQRMVKG